MRLRARNPQRPRGPRRWGWVAGKLLVLLAFVILPPSGRGQDDLVRFALYETVDLAGAELSAPVHSPSGSFASDLVPAIRPAGNLTRLPPAAEEDPAAPVPEVAAPSTDMTFGQRPEAPIYPRQFLRSQTVLLQTGDWQYDYGIAYALQQFSFPTINPNNNLLVRGEIQRRLLYAPLAVRYGWSERLQLFGNLPVGTRMTEIATSPSTDPDPLDSHSSAGGLGDLDAGFSYLIARGRDDYAPDVIATFATTFPTSEAFLAGSTFAGGLGNGVWALSGQLLMVHSYDPVVVFWGGGYRYQFARTFDGADIQLGQQISYQLGTGFAANDRVTLSAAFLGMYVTETQIDGQGIPGTSFEPLRMRLAVTAARPCRLVEPFVEIGMTEIAPLRVGVVWTR